MTSSLATNSAMDLNCVMTARQQSTMERSAKTWWITGLSTILTKPTTRGGLVGELSISLIPGEIRPLLSRCTMVADLELIFARLSPFSIPKMNSEKKRTIKGMRLGVEYLSLKERMNPGVNSLPFFWQQHSERIHLQSQTIKSRVARFEEGVLVVNS